MSGSIRPVGERLEGVLEFGPTQSPGDPGQAAGHLLDRVPDLGRVILLTRDPFAWHARVALAAMGEPRAVRWVLDELGAWTRERRTLAVAAAGQARLDAARELIEAMVGEDDRADAHAVEVALARLRGYEAKDGHGGQTR